MALSLNTSLAMLATQRAVGGTQAALSSAIARLSSGLRINSASDDAAGLAIADRLDTQIRGTAQAARNANDAISLSQTAESALGSIGEMLQRIRELAVQSANGTQSASDRAALQQEAGQLVEEIDRIGSQTRFNGVPLLDGSFSAQGFQVGAQAGQTITLPLLASARSSALGQYQGFHLAQQSVGTASSTAQPLTVTVGATAPIALGSVAVDARAIAAAINSSGIAGLSASANTTSGAGGSFVIASPGTSGTADFTINGVTIPIAGVGGSAALAGNRASAVAAINAQSAATGVIAADIGTGVSLMAPDGRNISLAYGWGSFLASGTSDFGLPSLPIPAATINLAFVAPEGTTGNVTFAQPSGLSSTVPIAATGTALAAVQIGTVAGANAALGSVDAALATIGKARASLGAVQNRFAAAIQNLYQSGQNLTAAASRIEDADMALETANLSRAQVLQEAGTAMIAQANQMPRQVLALLR